MSLHRQPARPPSHRQSRPTTLLAIFIGAILFVVAAALIVVLGLRLARQSSGPIVIPTVAMLPSAAPITGGGLNPAPPAPAFTVTPDGRPDLPPTWTPAPTPSITNSPSQEPATPTVNTLPPTLDPTALVDTYWEGDGYGSMWDVEMPGQTFGRFDRFPVNVCVVGFQGLPILPEQEAAINNAISEMNRVIPVQRVESRVFAHITVWMMRDTDFRQRAACGKYHDTVAACAVPNYTSIGLLLSSVWIDASDPCFEETLLHELTHALGIAVHSPDAGDIMYFQQTCGPGRYSQRDLNTLQALYSAPAFYPRAN